MSAQQNLAQDILLKEINVWVCPYQLKSEEHRELEEEVAVLLRNAINQLLISQF